MGTKKYKCGNFLLLLSDLIGNTLHHICDSPSKVITPAMETIIWLWLDDNGRFYTRSVRTMRRFRSASAVPLRFHRMLIPPVCHPIV